MAIYRPYSGSPTVKEGDRARFWGKVDRTGRCWNWTASLDDKGYGMFKLDGRMWKAPRVSWLFHNADPGKLMVCHRCDNPRCVHPDHLFVGTQSDNMTDCAAKGRLNLQNGLGGIHCLGVHGSLPRGGAISRHYTKSTPNLPQPLDFTAADGAQEKTS